MEGFIQQVLGPEIDESQLEEQDWEELLEEMFFGQAALMEEAEEEEEEEEEGQLALAQDQVSSDTGCRKLRVGVHRKNPTRGYAFPSCSYCFNFYVLPLMSAFCSIKNFSIFLLS